MNRETLTWPLSGMQARLVLHLSRELTGDLYIVGGYVRDRLSGRPRPVDLDLVHAGASADRIRRVAMGAGWRSFILDAARGHVRLLPGGSDAAEAEVDMAPMQGGDITADLSARDCTINAMAVRVDGISGSVVEGPLIDPLGGRLDLAAGQLRFVSAGNLIADPVRMLRMARLSASHELEIRNSDMAFLKSRSDLLGDMPGERLRKEGWGILLSGRPLPTAIRPALETDLYDAAFWHAGAAVSNGLERQIDRAAEDYLTSLSPCLEEQGWLLAASELGIEGTSAADTLRRAARGVMGTGRTRSHWLARLSLLALPLMRRYVWAEIGRDSDAARVEWHSEYKGTVTAHLRRLSFSRAESAHARNVTQGIGQLLRNLESGGESAPSIRAVHRFLLSCGYTQSVSAAVEVLLLTRAAIQARTVPGRWADGFGGWLDTAGPMLTASDFRRPKPVVSGDDLQAWFDLPTGPRIGELLGQVLEAQVCGEVETSEEARAYVTTLL